MKQIAVLFVLILFYGENQYVFGQQHLTPKQDSIVTKHLKKGAWKYHYFTKEWDQHIEEAIAADSTIAYLWQQKGMPYFKKQKYEIGMQSLDRAVALDNSWLDYRAFMKCIFVKNYAAALTDFEASIQRDPNGYIMDHPYSFYMALCYLQLNQYPKAFELLSNRVTTVEKEKGTSWVHPSELFYLGIAQFELGDYNNAIQTFDKALALYPEFSDAHYYKGKCYECTGQTEAAEACLKQARTDSDKGYTINEDSVIYEQYPYQVNWKMKKRS
ncbi:MAG: tetratricopeptide repeat protein [Bacteroidota bacterium]